MTANQISDHTPGPWHVDGPNAGLGAGIRDARDRRIAHTAESYTNHRDPILTDEAQANARLIASAPEMCDLLSATLELIDAYKGDLNRSQIQALRGRIAMTLKAATGATP